MGLTYIEKGARNARELQNEMNAELYAAMGTGIPTYDDIPSEYSASLIYVFGKGFYEWNTTISPAQYDVSNKTSMPLGTIIYLSHNQSLPFGFLEANGALVSRTTYSALFALIGTTYGSLGSTFRLPDLRGIFPRGWDNGRGYDSGRILGSYQDDAFQGHEHLQFGGTGSGISFDEGIAYATSYTSPTTGIASKTNYGTARYATETRPKNLALYALIKAY